MRIFRSSERSWTEGKGYSKRIILPEGDLGIKGSFLQEVTFHPGEKVPVHHHRIQTEVFYALTPASFEINGEELRLYPGDVIICEPGDKHGNPRITHEMRILVLKIDHCGDDTVWQED